mgnify:CR=1 FL=1
MNNNTKARDFFKKIVYAFVLLLLTSSALIDLYDNKNRIIKKIDGLKNIAKDKKTDQNFKYSKEILNGGYILFFRHAEREKWLDVTKYDALESDLHDKGINQSRNAENEYFSKAVCLNSRGKVQARAIGEVINYSGLPFGYIESSPSCRSRQTANLAFGYINKLNRNLVHKGPYYENLEKRNKYLKNYLLEIPIYEGTNTIISAHNSVISNALFDNFPNSNSSDSYKEDLSLEEGGFYVISRNKNKLYLEHEFHRFKDFQLNFFERKY